MIQPIIVLGGLGLGFGLILAYLSKRFSVKADPKVQEVRDLLPGINCGSCGYAGCDAFAQAIIEKDEDFKKCSPGVSNHPKIAKVLGKEVDCSTERQVARLKCNAGSDVTSEKYDYHGVKTCTNANQIASGPKSCSYGCIGYGDCVDVCPVGAITMNKNNLPLVDEDKCIACGKCVETCPKNLYELISVGHQVYVKCVSKDLAASVTKNCKVGCIACRICEKTCQFDAIHVNNNIAKIDYDKCTNCGACVLKCPRKIIIKVNK